MLRNCLVIIIILTSMSLSAETQLMNEIREIIESEMGSNDSLNRDEVIGLMEMIIPEMERERDETIELVIQRKNEEIEKIYRDQIGFILIVGLGGFAIGVIIGGTSK